MNVFKINWDRFILLLLPTSLRKPLLFAFLRAALFPLKQVYGQFIRMRENNLFLMKYDTSRRNLELALRIRFNDNNIYVVNAVYNVGLYLDFYIDDSYIRPNGFHTKRKTAYLNQYLNFWLEQETMTDDFTIYVPNGTFLTNEHHSGEITNFTRLFTLPGFKFSVEGY